MKIKLRQIKIAYEYCDTDKAHGKAPFELTIESQHMSCLKIWLCQDCIAKIPDQLSEARHRLYVKQLRNDIDIL